MTAEIIDITNLIERRKFMDRLVGEAVQLHNWYAQVFQDTGCQWSLQKARTYGMMLAELDGGTR